MKPITELQKAMKKAKLDFTLIINTTIKDPNMTYWTGMDLEYSFLIVPKTKKPTLLVSALEYHRAKKYARVPVKQFKTPIEEIAEIVGSNKKIGINTQYITVAMHKALKKKIKKCTYKPAEKILREIRITKTAKEISHLKEAARVADRIFSELTVQLKANKKIFKTEKDIADFIENEAKKHNTTISFPTIVASGKNGALPHYEPQDIKINKGFCVLDFGVRYKGYISDISRTIYFGKPTKKEMDAYNGVLKANMDAIKALKVGKTFKAIDKISRKQGTYPHALGHGIGIEVHEAPSVSPKSKDKIQVDMCFTIEPGKYIPGKWGIRIEDDIWMSKKGPVVMTRSTKKLLCF